MHLGATIRRLLRRILLWLAAALDDGAAAAEPQNEPIGGPPADWLERVRRGAPQLLEEKPAPRAAGSHPAVAPPPRRPRPPGALRIVASDEEPVFRGTADSAALTPPPPRRRPVAREMAGEAPVPPIVTPDEEPLLRGAADSAAATPPLRRRRLAVGDPAGEAPARRIFAEAAVPLRRTRAVIEEELVARKRPARTEDVPFMHRSHEVIDADGSPHTWRAVDEDATTIERRAMPWPDLPPQAQASVHRSTIVAVAAHFSNEEIESEPPPGLNDRWPELPPLPPFAEELLGPIESLDDGDRLRRLSDEQRGSGWNE